MRYVGDMGGRQVRRFVDLCHEKPASNALKFCFHASPERCQFSPPQYGWWTSVILQSISPSRELTSRSSHYSSLRSSTYQENTLTAHPIPFPISGPAPPIPLPSPFSHLSLTPSFLGPRTSPPPPPSSPSPYLLTMRNPSATPLKPR